MYNVAHRSRACVHSRRTTDISLSYEVISLSLNSAAGGRGMFLDITQLNQPTSWKRMLLLVGDVDCVIHPERHRVAKKKYTQHDGGSPVS